MADKAINELLTRSKEKDMTNNEKDITMNFVREIIVKKKCFATHYHYWMFMEKNSSQMPKFD